MNFKTKKQSLMSGWAPSKPLKNKRCIFNYVYIIKCFDNSYYTGITNNIEKRFKVHQIRYIKGDHVMLGFIKSLMTFYKPFIFKRKL